MLFFVLLFVLLLALGTASAAAPVLDGPVLPIIQMAAINLVLVVPMLLPIIKRIFMFMHFIES